MLSPRNGWPKIQQTLDKTLLEACTEGSQPRREAYSCRIDIALHDANAKSLIIFG
jgi:hypothetical protein